MTRRFLRNIIVLLVFAAAGCSSPTQPAAPAEFVVDVAGERFVMRLTDAETIALAEANRLGRNSRFPLGPLRAGNGGFNAPWTWHVDPSETRLVEAAIELCDGRPSYVEQHQNDYPTYCPWGAGSSNAGESPGVAHPGGNAVDGDVQRSAHLLVGVAAEPPQ